MKGKGSIDPTFEKKCDEIGYFRPDLKRWATLPVYFKWGNIPTNEGMGLSRGATLHEHGQKAYDGNQGKQQPKPLPN